MKANEQKLAELIARDTVSLLYSNSWLAVMVSILVMSTLVFSFDSPATYPTKIIIWSITMVVLLLRLADYLHWKLAHRKPHSEYNYASAVTRFTLACLITACCWSAYSIATFDYIDNTEFSATFIVICALATGATSVLSANKKLGILYSIILLLPLSFSALLVDNDIHNKIGLFGLIYTFVIAIAGTRLASFTKDAIEVKNKSVLQLEQVQAERSEVERVNREIKQANEQLDKINLDLEAEVKKRTDEIYQISSIEPLTGLINRSAFTLHLKELVAQAQNLEYKFSLLLMNVDGFKTINDTLGQGVGDTILVEIGKRLRMFSQEQHIGRWGGDEFVITLPYSDANSALSVAKAIKTSLQQPMDIESNQVNLSVSIGIVMFPDHAQDPQEMVQMADLTMQVQKQSEDTTPRVFTNDIFERKLAAQKLKEGLKHAIENKQLHVMYQPILDAKSGQVWSFEALLRWNFDGKPVYPDVFIPLAEQSGLIREIGAWVLHRACIDAAQWHFAEEASVSVNVSIIQLMDDNFEKTLDSALKTSGLAPERLHLELTESVFAENRERILNQISAIKARNIQISIDDFGTGYSSLSQLQSLNFDHIKIDRSFVNDLENGQETIIRATLNIAKELGCLTVAEGVESEEIAQRLTQMGADTLQGYLFSKPIANQDLASWHAARATNYGFNSIKIA